MASEFEELRINVKMDSEQTAEQTRQLKDNFRTITDIQYAAQLEKLGRQFNLTDAQVKQLAEAVAKPQNALNAFATGFGRAGTILLAFEATMAVAKAAYGVFEDLTKRTLDVQNLAERMGNVHAAQVEANLRMMERDYISRSRGMAMMETFAKRKTEFMLHNSELRRSILEEAGPYTHVVMQHFRELAEAPDLETWMNLVRRFADEIEKEYVRRGEPERGAEEKRKYLQRWFGLDDISQLTTDFIKVSKETEERWDRNLTVAKEFHTVTTNIKHNIDDILRGVMTRTLEELGIGPALRLLDKILAAGAKGHEELGAMTPEERAAYEQKLIDEGDAALRKWFRDLFRTETTDEDRRRAEENRRILPPSPPPLYQRGQHLLELSNDNQILLLTEEKRLVENLQFINANLAIIAAEAGKKQFGPGFHNQPQGGATGESNPIQIPAGVAQPGGGAAAESRTEIGFRAGRGSRSRDQTFSDRGGTADASGELIKSQRQRARDALADVNRYLKAQEEAADPRRMQRALERVEPGSEEEWELRRQQALKGVKDDEIERYFSSEFGSPSVPEGYGPGSGLPRYKEIETLIGKEGRRPGDTEEDIRRREEYYSGDWRQRQEGKPGEFYNPRTGAPQGIPISYRVTNGGGAQTSSSEAMAQAGAAALQMQPEPAEVVAQAAAAALSPERMTPSQRAEAMFREREFAGETPPLTEAASGRATPVGPSEYQLVENIAALYPGLGAVGPIGRAFGQALRGTRDIGAMAGGLRPEVKEHELDRGRHQLDRDLSDELDVRGRLNVDVEAPAGTEVKAIGGGMFENNVTVDRRMDEARM